MAKAKAKANHVPIPKESLQSFIVVKADAEAELARCKTMQTARVELALAVMKDAAGISPEVRVMFQGNVFMIVPEE